MKGKRFEETPLREWWVDGWPKLRYPELREGELLLSNLAAQKLTWLELEMGAKWNERRRCFLLERSGAPVPLWMIEHDSTSFATFQRAVFVLVGRMDGARSPDLSEGPQEPRQRTRGMRQDSP